MTQQRYDKYALDDKSVTITAHSGNYGSGSQVLVIDHTAEKDNSV